ncbi:MAG: amidohydrolase [Candidatus Thermoplasmatota archaeon]
MPTLLVKDATIVTQDAKRRVVRGDLRAEEGVITHVGPIAPQHADVVIEAKGDILLPGLVNAHTHSPMTLLRGLGDDLPLEDWLRTRIWPAEKNLTRSDIEAGTDLALLEMTRTGTTAFADMYFYADATAECTKKAGLRGLIAGTLVDFDTPEHKYGSLRDATRKFVQRWSGHPLISPAIAPHSTYTCSDETLDFARQLRDETGARIHTHCSETRFEVQDVLQKRGARPVGVLEKHDLLRDAVLAHCGWVTKEEIQTLSRHAAHAVHCPVSNLKLATGGTMPFMEMLDAKLNVALGTDGAASNNTLDLIETAKFAALVQKQHRWDARAANAQQVLDAATRGGARALHTGSGALEVGAPADLVLVSTRAPHMAPLHDPVSTLAYCANGADVRATIVAGRVLYLDGQHKTLDAERVIARANEAAERVASSAGLR